MEVNDVLSTMMDVRSGTTPSTLNVTMTYLLTMSTPAETDEGDPFISGHVRLVTLMVNNVVVGSLLGFLGIIGNVINIIIFGRNSRGHSINVSLTALAVGDIGALLSLQWFNICVNPWFRDLGIPFEPIEIQTLTGGFPHFYFTRVTGWITAFINLERCLSIIKPLRVKLMITCRLAVAINVGIFLLMILTVVPVYCTTYFDWKFYPERNKTLLGVKYTEDAASIQSVTFTITNIIMVSAFATVIVCTMIITISLHGSSKWRHAATAQSANQNGSANGSSVPVRGKRLVKIIVVISLIYLVCSLPMVCFTMARAIEPELNIIGRYANLNWFIASIVFLMQTINSSVNIIIYHRMSTTYRDAFKKLFSRCCRGQLTPRHDSISQRADSISHDKTTIILLATNLLNRSELQLREKQQQLQQQNLRQQRLQCQRQPDPSSTGF